ncbi:transcriptional regulatory protein, C-terminal domain protein [Bordetella bronchiseptica F-1]|nr:transcriptional regulatory protein, C-terminal domain protein [Bordetella bronchiseptica F-1]
MFKCNIGAASRRGLRARGSAAPPVRHAFPRARPSVDSEAPLMNSTLDVIFLVRDDAAHRKQLEHLAYLGFKIRACTELIEVYDNCAAHACPLVILSAPLADIHIAAARLRAIDRRVGIIAMEAFADSESRIRTLLCGADACLPTDVNGLELAAVLQALLRRIVALAPQPETAELARSPDPGIDIGMEALALEPAMAPPDSKWHLTNQGWTLVSPGGRTLGLTTGEREFLSRLMRAPERKISREALIADDLSAPGGGDQGAQRSRFVDVMISRLRRKAAHHQMPLPIRALHGWGYMFAAEVADEAGARGRH